MYGPVLYGEWSAAGRRVRPSIPRRDAGCAVPSARALTVMCARGRHGPPAPRPRARGKGHHCGSGRQPTATESSWARRARRRATPAQLTTPASRRRALQSGGSSDDSRAAWTARSPPVSDGPWALLLAKSRDSSDGGSDFFGSRTLGERKDSHAASTVAVTFSVSGLRCNAARAGCRRPTAAAPVATPATRSKNGPHLRAEVAPPGEAARGQGGNRAQPG
jgi:hypothetical protein